MEKYDFHSLMVSTMKFVPFTEELLTLNHLNCFSPNKNTLIETISFNDYPNIYFDFYSDNSFGIRCKEINLNYYLSIPHDIIFQWGSTEIGVNKDGQVFLSDEMINLGSGSEGLLSLRNDVAIHKDAHCE
ncbi:TPA: hypothetical protein ACX6QE_001606 [Photobacterium damselae]